MNLEAWGFKQPFKSQLEVYKEQQKYHACIPGRVLLEHKHSYRVLTEEGELLASVSGKYAYEAHSREDYPAVGDWVLVEKLPNEYKAVIYETFPRFSKFSRKAAGQQIVEQIVAANVDLVLLVMSLNADFNLRRLERYLTAAWDSGAVPLVVLTKSDLSGDLESAVKEIENVAFGADVYAVSALTGEGMEPLRARFKKGITGALIGSSGAGKSTLTNALYGEEIMKVSSIREDDAKGRHTTTHRELVQLPSGGCLIDTPGMRELQLWEQSGDSASGFDDIDSLGAECRYRDCTHRSEPGCAVSLAIEEGRLEEERLRSYFKLQKELAYIERKTNMQAKLAESKKWKQSSKQYKTRK